MYEHFKSDKHIFNNDISFLIKLRDKPGIIYMTKEKHKEELAEEISIENKKIDLLIWNAMYTKEIVANGIATKYLHPIYNKFYDTIPTLNSLESLQDLELKMVDTYMNLVINDVEVTQNHVINRILKHLHLNIESHKSLEQLASEVNLSPGYISDCFKKEMGITVMNYAKKIRIDRAKVLLLTTNQSILDIGLTLGFHDQSHFYKTFKKFTGMSPSQYRNTNYK